MTLRRFPILMTAFALGCLAQAPPQPPPGPGGPPAGPGAPPANAGGLRPLSAIPVPRPSNLGKYVRDERALVALGKALYWDMQVGSDGKTACATCHFHAGADHRSQNQLADPLAPFVLNATLGPDDFPFHKLADPNDNRSRVLANSTARAGSAGVPRRSLTGFVPGRPADDGFDLADAPSFSLNGANLRQVTGRNAPSVIDAVFNFRNFWDGRASNIFTGMTPFGESDARPNAVVSVNGGLVAEQVRVDNSSLASQAVGPVVNSVEMAYEGRTWPKVARRLLGARPLAMQRVSPTDSVLGQFANPAGPGLSGPATYAMLVQSAFQPAYWNSTQSVDGFGQAEFNFALFFGLAVQAYESTLISGNTRFDRFLGGDGTALNPQEQAGLALFRGRAACATCHGGPETTQASVRNSQRVDLVVGRNPGLDVGFFRTGATPIAQDIGLGGLDDFGRLLSIAATRDSAALPAAQGAFKSPALRNVEFTGPYFHNGGQATLEQVIDFYSRGGDFPTPNNPTGVRRLNLNAGERASLVALLKSMSDDRVRFERAPFDHPELCVPVGAAETAPGVVRIQTADPRFTLSAADKWVGFPPTGAQGSSVPLQTFDEMLRGIGNDGSRAHAMTGACRIFP